MENEKPLLLDEIHHRVKNNFQIIISLIELQVVRHPENKNVFVDLINRIKSMSLIYENFLLEDDLTCINFCEYLKFLIQNLRLTYNNSTININLNYSKELLIKLEQATPIGVAINELLMNIYQHAYSNTTYNKKNASIFIEEIDNKISIFIEDNGVGIEQHILQDSNTLGLGLVKMLVNEQLDGKLEIKNDNGTKVKIEFEKK